MINDPNYKMVKKVCKQIEKNELTPPVKLSDVPLTDSFVGGFKNEKYYLEKEFDETKKEFFINIRKR